MGWEVPVLNPAVADQSCAILSEEDLMSEIADDRKSVVDV
jgi:hypothetical protein